MFSNIVHFFFLFRLYMFVSFVLFAAINNHITTVDYLLLHI